MVEASFHEKRDSLSRNLWRKLIVYKQMIMFCLQVFAFIKCLLCNINSLDRLGNGAKDALERVELHDAHVVVAR